MTKFEIDLNPIEGLRVITPNEEGRSRDFLFDLNELNEQSAEMGIEEEFVEHASESFARGVIRGLHFQSKNPFGVLLGVKSGSILAIGVDLRPENKSFGAAYGVELTAENERMLYIPPYFAYGFLTLEQKTEVVSNFTQEYDTAEVSSIIWDDEILAINWQFERFEIDEKRLSISPRDRKAPSFRSYNPNLLWPNRPKKSRYAISR